MQDGSPRKRHKKIPLEVKSIITKRLFKIFEKVKVKLIEQFKVKIGHQYYDDIENAIEDPSIAD